MSVILNRAATNDMSFTEHRDITVCFTGHRPKSFTDESFFSKELVISTIKTLLALMIGDAYKRGARYFITGMAQGVDLWAGEILLYMKTFLPDVHIIAAEPYPNHGRGLTGNDFKLYTSLEKAADAVVNVCPEYAKWCFSRRNEYMLAHSSAVLGVVRENSGGTVSTLSKATRFCTQRRVISLENYKAMIPLFERYPEVYLMTMPSQRYAFWEKHQRLLYQCGLYYED